MLSFLRSVPTMDRIVFTHIGKTGGNTVNDLLREIRSHHGLNMLALAGATSTFANPRIVQKLLADTPYRSDDFDILTGHIPFASARRIFRKASYMTVLRDPRMQAISNFCSQPGHRDQPDFGLSDFISLISKNSTAEWAMDNQQTRMLCDNPRIGKPASEKMLKQAKENLIRYYGVVGFADAMDSFFATASRLCGLHRAPPVPVKNATGAYAPFVTNDILEFVEQRNYFDMRLFAWAKENEHRFEQEHLTFDRRDAGRVAVIGQGLFDIEQPSILPHVCCSPTGLAY